MVVRPQRTSLHTLVHFVTALLIATTPARAQTPHQHEFAEPPNPSLAAPETSFEEMMHEAMDHMDKGMVVGHSGDPDRDFAAMMIPHHQGAIDMAKAELQFGRNPVLRRLAQGIIVEQQQEIELMRRELQRFAVPVDKKEN